MVEGPEGKHLIWLHYLVGTRQGKFREMAGRGVRVGVMQTADPQAWEQTWLPLWPLASDDLLTGVYRYARNEALGMRYVELAAGLVGGRLQRRRTRRITWLDGLILDAGRLLRLGPRFGMRHHRHTQGEPRDKSGGDGGGQNHLHRPEHTSHHRVLIDLEGVGRSLRTHHCEPRNRTTGVVQANLIQRTTTAKGRHRRGQDAAEPCYGGAVPGGESPVKIRR